MIKFFQSWERNLDTSNVRPFLSLDKKIKSLKNGKICWSHQFYPFCRTLSNPRAVDSFLCLRVKLPVGYRTKEKKLVLSHKENFAEDIFSACLNVVYCKGALYKLFRPFSSLELRLLDARTDQNK